MRLWDTLPARDCHILANDVEHQTELSKWFYATVKLETAMKFENPDFWMNEPYSFRYSQF